MVQTEGALSMAESNLQVTFLQAPEVKLAGGREEGPSVPRSGHSGSSLVT
jgi:hypothetical protein